LDITASGGIPDDKAAALPKVAQAALEAAALGTEMLFDAASALMDFLIAHEQANTNMRERMQARQLAEQQAAEAEAARRLCASARCGAHPWQASTSLDLAGTGSPLVCGRTLPHNHGKLMASPEGIAVRSP